MKAGSVLKNDIKFAVFEAKVAKDVVLHDRTKIYYYKKSKLYSVEGVNGPTIKVGSLQIS